MKPEKLLLELEQLIEQAGFSLRKERGSFRGDHCVVEGDRLVVINKNRTPESQIGILARVLKDVDMEDRYIKPVVRKELEELWTRYERLGDDETEPEGTEGEP